MVDAKELGIRKGFITGAGIGVMYFTIFGAYALAFWYGGKLIIEENPPYDVGVLLTVSLFL